MEKYKFIPAFIRKQLFEGHQRSIKAKKNILAALFIKGLNILTGLMLVPMTIDYVNPTKYGIWLTISSIIGWMGFFDIGFGHGLRNKFAEAVAKNDFKLARTYLSTTYAILSIMVSIIIVAFLIVNPFLDWTIILNTPSEMAAELSVVALIVFVFFCIHFVLKLISTVITANQESAKASLLDLIGKIISLAIIYVLTKTTEGSLLYLGLSLSVIPAVVLILSSIWFYSKQYKAYSPSLKYVNFSYGRNLLSLGIIFFVIQIAVIIRFQTSNIIISQLFGPKEVTPFNIAYKYFGIANMLFSIIITPFWSAFTEAWVKKDIPWIKGTVKKLQMIWLIFSIGILLMLLISDFAYRIWVGSEIVVPLGISIVLAFNVIVTCWGEIYFYFINGVGKLRVQFYFYIFTGIINIPLSIFLAKMFGIVGVVLSLGILGFIGALWTPVQYNKIVNNKATGIWNK